MYSKNKGITYQQTVLTPPPGYDGSRFRHRSDGRDDSFPLYEEKSPSHRTVTKEMPECECEAIDKCECCECDNDSKNNDSNKGDCQKSSPMSVLAPILKGIGKEELLIIALIILLSGEHGRPDTDTILLLALLLCAG